MADKTLSQVIGGGGSYFQSDGIVVETIASGQTGSLLSLPEVAGKVYRLFLLTTGSTSQQAGISLIANSITLESEKTLVDNSGPSADAPTEFGVYRNYSSDNSLTNRGMYDIVECESFEITKNAGNTTQDIWCSYEVGEIV